ncbi:MAG TPA: nuclear transport factor 2 family protein [Anaerolineales bacterium]|nr:nuclear transport factor 2 family protein [Anaerolineales bacterium]
MSTNVHEEAEKALVGLEAEKLVSLYADEFVFEDTSSKEHITNKVELKEYFKRLFSMPGVYFSDVSFIRIADRGAGEWSWGGKSLQRGVDFTIRGASLFVLEGETIKAETIFYDPGEAYK